MKIGTGGRGPAAVGGRLFRFLGYLTWIALTLLALAPAPPNPSPALPLPLHGEVLGVHVTAGDETVLRGQTYVAVGDSISAGKYADSFPQTFPARVADRLGMHLVLVARSGALADYALPRLAAIVEAHPALVTIELGTNDAGYHTPMTLFSQQYESIVSAVSGPNTQVLCIGSWLPAAGYDRLIADACQRHGGTFVSLQNFYFVNAFHANDGTPTFVGASDWFHPGNEGHAAIAATILDSLNGVNRPALPPDGAFFARPRPTVF